MSVLLSRACIWCAMMVGNLHVVFRMAELANLKHERFCRALQLAGGNVASASAAAGYSVNYAYSLVQRPEVAARLEELRAEEHSLHGASREAILRTWQLQALADPRELVQHRLAACRHCWGRDHAYQWRTRREFRIAWLNWLDEHRKSVAVAGCVSALPEHYTHLDDPRIPSDHGGYGYSVKAEPNPHCPDCHGMGIPWLDVADTTKLSAAGMAIYGGVRQTAQGFEIVIRDQSRLLERLAKEMGLFSDEGGRATRGAVTALPSRPHLAA